MTAGTPSIAGPRALPVAVAEVLAQLSDEERQQIAPVLAAATDPQLAGIAHVLAGLATPAARVQWARAQLGMRPSSPAVGEICRALVEDLPGGFACAVVDLSSGALIGSHNKTTGRSALHEATVSGLVDMFRGPSVTRVAQLVRMQRGVPEDGAYYFEEIQIVSRHNLHFASALAAGRMALMLVAARTADREHGWRLVHHHIPRIEAVLGTAITT